MKKTYYIYGLIDPISKEIKYVGQTTNIERRYKQHLFNSKISQKEEKYNWIEDLKSKGLKIEIVILEKIITDKVKNALEIEQKWTSLHHKTIVNKKDPINNEINYYNKYLKGKKTTLLVSNKTKDELNKFRYDLRLKSMEDLIIFLIQNEK